MIHCSSAAQALLIDSFSKGASTPPSNSVLFSNTIEPLPSREPLKVLLIGSRRGVTTTIQTLYRLGFAEVREWSPLLPAPNPGEVMSILTRYLSF